MYDTIIIGAGPAGFTAGIYASRREMKTLIIGNGEIGKSLQSVLSKEYNVSMYDIRECSNLDDYIHNEFEIIHICFPYSDKFIQFVQEYQKIFKPKYTVVHSTTPTGTCRKLDAIHSPCIGIHPFLEEGIRTFTKYLGGKDAGKVANYFRKAGILIKCTN